MKKKPKTKLKANNTVLILQNQIDGSASFDFTGTYNLVELHKYIVYTIDDGRMVRVAFHPQAGETHITENFEIESTHSEEQQQSGWQSILNSFKKYVESL